MAPQLTEEDYKFLVCCIKHTPGKPDFSVVATELGMKNKQQAYKRHYDLMKKIGGNTANINNGTPGSSPTGTKRGRPTKKEKASMLAVADDDDDSEKETPSKVKKTEESD